MITEPWDCVGKRDSPIRQRVGLGDLQLPSILGFQSLCCIETEVNVKSSVGLSPCGAPALDGLCFHLCMCKPLLWSRVWRAAQSRKQSSFCLAAAFLGFPRFQPLSSSHCKVRFSWGGQKGRFPNHTGSQALIWIVQLIHREDTSWADLKPFWQEGRWFRLTRGHCWSGRMASSLLGEQDQVWEQKTDPTDSLQLNQGRPRASPNSLLSRTKPLRRRRKRRHLLGIATDSALLPLLLKPQYKVTPTTQQR